MAKVAGIYVRSNNPGHLHQRVDWMPTTLANTSDVLSRYQNEYRTFFSGQRGTQNQLVRSPSFRIKEALLTLGTLGYGNPVAEPNADAIAIFEGFQDSLKLILPPSLGFRRFTIRIPEIVLETDTGDFSFDAVSGGIAALIDVAWQLFLQQRSSEAFVAVIDEPENHLHPELQRLYFPRLLEAFPKVQFISATHNPFIVGSVADSNVYVLRYDQSNRVRSDLLEEVNKAGTSNEILREVLGLSLTLPVWVEERLNTLADYYSSVEINEETFRSVREELGKLGMDQLFPEAIGHILDRRR